MADAQPTPEGEEDIKAMQQKSDEGDVTRDLVLKHRDATLPIYVRRQMKHLKYVSKILKKTPEKHLKTIAKHTQYPNKTLATYM